MQANVAAVLTVVGNFSRPGHLTAGFAYNRDLMDALGMCLVRGGDAQRHETLDVLAHMALPPPAAVVPVPAGEADHAATVRTVHRAHRGPPQWFVELLPEANVEMLDDDERHRVGLTYKATPNLSFYGNYSESFEPNVWDLTEDAKEGPRAFKEKRAPNFQMK